MRKLAILLAGVAVVSLTTGGPESMFLEGGLNPPMSAILLPIEHGVFKFLGFSVLPAFFVWGPARLTDEQRRDVLDEYASHLLNNIQVPGEAPPRARG